MRSLGVWGGVLLGEACGADVDRFEDAVAFRQSFGELAGKLGPDLGPVERGHSLLSSLHLFTSVPEGVDGPGLMIANGGIVYSDGDYGCLWDGGWEKKPAPRESIRSGVELGVNLAAYSAQRSRRRSLKVTQPVED